MCKVVKINGVSTLLSFGSRKKKTKNDVHNESTVEYQTFEEVLNSCIKDLSNEKEIDDYD